MSNNTSGAMLFFAIIIVTIVLAISLVRFSTNFVEIDNELYNQVKEMYKVNDTELKETIVKSLEDDIISIKEYHNIEYIHSKNKADLSNKLRKIEIIGGESVNVEQ